MVHTAIFMTFIVISSSFTHASIGKKEAVKNNKAILSLSTLPTFNKTDKKAVKYFEDYYWSYRKKHFKSVKRAYQYLKSHKTLLNTYNETLKDGLDLSKRLSSKKIISCEFKSPRDRVESKFIKLFKSQCSSHNLEIILNPKTNLTDNDKNYLSENLWVLKSKSYRKRIISKINHAHYNDKSFFSDLIKKYIYTKKSLPPQEVMSHIQVDQQITQFIQENLLFDNHDRYYFTNEFKRLINDFKTSFLEGDQDVAREALDQAISFFEQNEAQIDDSKAWTLFFLSGKKLAEQPEEEGSYDLALDLFKFSEKVADEEDTLYDSKFQSLITFYRQKKLDSAVKFITDNSFVTNFDKISSQLRFWTAYIYEKRNEMVRAKALYLQQISLNPLSYYSILSLKQLRTLNSNYTTAVLFENNDNVNITTIPLSQESYDSLALFKLFNEAKSSYFGSLQGSQLRSMSSHSFFPGTDSNQNALKSKLLIHFFGDSQDYLSSFKEAYTALNSGKVPLTKPILRSLFPNKYEPIVKSQKTALDHRVIMSLIRQESAFNSYARSSVGARGLMQIMPATGRMFKRRLKTSQLYNPKVNINIGVRFLERLFKRYEGDLVFALSAYNAGIGNVTRWIKTLPFTNDTILNVEMIPYKETKKYVKLIYRNLFFYRILDEDTKHLDIAVNESFNIYTAKN